MDTQSFLHKKYTKPLIPKALSLWFSIYKIKPSTDFLMRMSGVRNGITHNLGK